MINKHFQHLYLQCLSDKVDVDGDEYMEKVVTHRESEVYFYSRCRDLAPQSRNLGQIKATRVCIVVHNSDLSFVFQHNQISFFFFIILHTTPPQHI